MNRFDDHKMPKIIQVEVFPDSIRVLSAPALELHDDEKKMLALGPKDRIELGSTKYNLNLDVVRIDERAYRSLVYKRQED